MEVRGRTETSINEAESLHQKHGNPTRAAALSRRSMWITGPAAVDNYRQSLLAVCGCPVDGVGTSDAAADGAWMQTSDPSTPGHTLYQRFCFQQVLEPEAIFRVIHRKGAALFTTTICIHKEKGKPIDRLASILSTSEHIRHKPMPSTACRCDGTASQCKPDAGLRNPLAIRRYKAHVPAPIACRYHVALGAAPRRL